MSERRAVTAPSTAAVPLATKVREWTALLGVSLERARTGMNLDFVFEDIATYHALYRQHAGRELADAKIFEVGYGPRPYRLLAMVAMGIDVAGVDAERHTLRFRPRDLVEIARTSGPERAAKTAFRSLTFDPIERRVFRRELGRRGLRFPADVAARLMVSDAADVALPEGSVDLIVSEDVFEHVAAGSLERLVPAMRRWLKPDGLAFIRPNIYTGISGGHVIEWSGFPVWREHAERKSDPWDHLRARRFQPNTHLNRLWRRDFRALFEKQFTIEAEHVRVPDLGRKYLTGQTAVDLADIPDEELFSNQVLFVLRRKP